MARGNNLSKVATHESRAKGGKARAAKIRADKEQAREFALGRAAGLVERALDQLEAALDSGNDRIALQAARDVLDRVLGKPAQALEVEPFPPKINLSVLTDEELAELKRILLKGKP